MAAPTLGDELATGGLPYVLDSVLGSFWGKVLLCDVAVAILICTLAIQTACSRLMFSMARDGRLPFSKQLSHINERTGTPIAPSILIEVLCIAVLLVNVGNAAMLHHPRQRLHHPDLPRLPRGHRTDAVPAAAGWPRRGTDSAPAVDAEGKKLFSLGRFGVVVNLLAVIYGALMVVNLAWPRAEVFDPAGDMPILRWAGPICIVATTVVGIACYPRGKEHPAVTAGS